MSSGPREWKPSATRGRSHYGKLAGVAGAVVIIGAVAWAMYNPHGAAQDQPPPAKLASDNSAPANGVAAAPGDQPAPSGPQSAASPQSTYTPTAPTTPPATQPAQTAAASSDQAAGQAAQQSPAPSAGAASDRQVAAADTGTDSDADTTPASGSEAAASPKAKHHAAPTKDKAAKDSTQVATNTTPVAPAPTASDALKQWWATGGDDSAFKVKAVGQGSDGASVVLVFSQPVDAAAAAQHLRLLNGQGAAVGGNWQSGENPYVLALQGVQTGRYVLFIDQSIASAKGQSLGADVQGPVYVSQRLAQADNGSGSGQP